MTKKNIFMIIMFIFLLLNLSACSQEINFGEFSNNNSEQDIKNTELEKLINELSLKHKAEIFSGEYNFGYSIEVQDNIKNKKIIVKNVLLNDIYKKDNKIFASFEKFGFRTIFLILELDEEQKEIIINKTSSDYYAELSIVVEVKEVVKPELVINALPISENQADYDIDFEKNNLVVNGELVDFIYLSENDNNEDINIYHFGDDLN